MKKIILISKGEPRNSEITEEPLLFDLKIAVEQHLDLFSEQENKIKLTTIGIFLFLP